MEASFDSVSVERKPLLTARLRRRKMAETIAVDLAKSVFEIVVSTAPGKIGARERVPRRKFLDFFVNRPAATVVMEACGSAHFWARKIQSLGHTVVLLPPAQVRPYVVRNKTDRTDVRGMLEAHRNEDIRPVPINTVKQQALASLDRVRSAWVADRTAKINLLLCVGRNTRAPI